MDVNKRAKEKVPIHNDTMAHQAPTHVKHDSFFEDMLVDANKEAADGTGSLNSSPAASAGLDECSDIISRLESLSLDEDRTPRVMSPDVSSLNISSSCASSSFRLIPRRCSGNQQPPQRPRLMRKAATTPPEMLKMLSSAPRPPRRAISARFTRPDLPLEDGVHCSLELRSQHPKESQFGTSVAKSAIKSRKSKARSLEGVGSHYQGSPRKQMPSAQLQRYEVISTEPDARCVEGASESTPVKAIPQSIQVEGLETGLADSRKRGLPDVPTSGTETPRELYGLPMKRPRPSPASPGVGLGRRKVLRPAKSNREKPPIVPLVSHGQPRGRFGRRSLPRLSERDVYLPGPIRLNNGVFTSSLSLISSLDLLAGQEERDDVQSRADVSMSDETAEYFQGMCACRPVGADELDRFWEQEDQDDEAEEDSEPVTTPSTHGPDWKARVRLGLEEPTSPPKRPNSVARVSSTSRQLSRQGRLVTTTPPNARQMVKLRRILRPATWSL
ncbi:hypothetical protein BU24DRAFT_232932 [Aaosphaeria arxii CBS 175.79]|uniref:Uncharacterized protein n=1 Tax=Aaosphaeria arxii CBS 175.79 TaxID=1450172 RepID=A0A6A5XJW3_9PLEO|nr:uncharacterized protein BU24DRAFT_232932 [Aaosphaeria arxii CBS 175.79]KAF2013243.1 hypothetical protein BU24DRAFT_232932 [Aaosphaeria arxii CBS 175.79]